jgi:hypothetical protein
MGIGEAAAATLMTACSPQALDVVLAVAQDAGIAISLTAIVRASNARRETEGLDVAA